MLPRFQTLIRTSLVTALVGLAVTGCGGSHHHTHSTATRTATSNTTTATTTAAATPITSATWTVADSPVQDMRVSIYDLRRQGPYLVLDFGVRCLSRSGCQIGGLLSTDAHDQKSMAAYEHQDSTPSGVVLVDPVNADEYRVAQNSAGDAFTSALYDVDIDPGRTYLEWTRFRLPPSSVSSLDVAFPSGGPEFSDVPVSDDHAPVTGPGMVKAQAQTQAPAMNPDSTSGMTLPVVRLTLTSGTDSQYVTNTATRSRIALRGDVLFHFDKSNLTSQAHGILTAVASQIKTRARGTIQVTGYTDDIGSQAFNLGLSRRRAQSVVTALRALTPGVRYTSAGRGKLDPVATNSNAAGRALNRRVTVAFAVKRTPKPSSSAAATSSASSGALTFESNNGGRFRLSIASARREGQLVLAELHVTCLKHGGCLAGDALGAGSDTVPPEPDAAAFFGPNTGFQFGDNPAYDSVNGFSLLDPRSGVVYLAALADLVPVTASFNASAQLPTDHPFTMWAYYPAPPASTTRVRLIAPETGGGIAVHSSGRADVQVTAG